MLVGVAELQMSRRELRVQSGYSHECKADMQAMLVNFTVRRFEEEQIHLALITDFKLPHCNDWNDWNNTIVVSCQSSHNNGFLQRYDKHLFPRSSPTQNIVNIADMSGART